MNKKRLLLICFIFCLNLIISISVQAATSKQTPIYNKFLQKNPSYTWFCTLDINKDGIKELIVSTNQTERFSNNYLIYTVKKGKMVYIGKIQHTLSTDGKNKAIFYNPKFKAIREIYQGAQTIEYNLYKISNSTFKEALYACEGHGHIKVYCIRKNGKFQDFPITTSGINSYKKSLKQYFYKGCKSINFTRILPKIVPVNFNPIHESLLLLYLNHKKEFYMKQRSYIIKGVILTLLVTLLNFTPVYASNDVAKLSLHAFGNSLLLNSNGKTQGHAFLTIKNISRKTLYFNDYPIKPSHTLSVSIWPDSTNDTFKYGGVYINRELFVDKDIETYSISQNISAESLEKIEAATPSESYYHDGSTDCLWHNCTTYSLKMWNTVVSKDYRISAKTVLFADAPKKLVKEIRKKSNYQKKTFIQDKPIYTTDVFHINKNKDLVPVVIKAPTLHSSRVSNNSVKLSWTSSKKMYHNQTNVTAYLVKYNTTSNPNDSQELYVKDGFHTTVKNLKSNTSYKFTVTALYSKGNYRVQSSDSNTLVITTKSANTYETELSEVLNETASEASKQLGLNKPFSSGRTVYYTKHGSTKDRTCFITCSFDNLNQKRKWSFYAFDDSISVYGAKIGMTENSAKQKLLKNKWKVFTRYYNKATDSGFIIYKRGTYSMHVSQKHNKLNQISFFNNEGLYYS